MSADGYKQLLSNLGPDPMEESMKLVTLGSRLPSVVHWLACQIIHYGLKDELFGQVLCMWHGRNGC